MIRIALAIGRPSTIPKEVVDMVELIANASIGAVVGVMGAVIGAKAQTWFEYRHRVLPDLHASALRCLARLDRIKAARGRGDGDVVKNETWLLGADLDRYVQAIGAASMTSEASQHESVYPTLADILVAGGEARGEDIEQAIDKLKQVQA